MLFKTCDTGKFSDDEMGSAEGTVICPPPSHLRPSPSHPAPVALKLEAVCSHRKCARDGCAAPAVTPAESPSYVLLLAPKASRDTDDRGTPDPLSNIIVEYYLLVSASAWRADQQRLESKRSHDTAAERQRDMRQQQVGITHPHPRNSTLSHTVCIVGSWLAGYLVCLLDCLAISPFFCSPVFIVVLYHFRACEC